MPGTSTKFKISVARKIAKAEEAGRLSAQYEIKKRSHEINAKSLILSLREHLGKLFDNTSMREWLYVIAYLSAVYLAYQTITKIEVGFWDFLTSMFGGIGFKIFPQLLPLKPEISPFVLDFNILATSLVIGYEVLKIDLGDVTSAVTKLAPLITSLVASI